MWWNLNRGCISVRAWGFSRHKQVNCDSHQEKKSTSTDISLEMQHAHFTFFLLRFLEKFYIKISCVPLKRHVTAAVKSADSWGTKAEVLSKLSLKVTFCSHSWIRSTFISAFFSSFLDQVPETTVGSPRDLWQTSSSVGRQTGLPYISLSTPELFICLLADTSWECKTDPVNVKKRWHKTQERSEITAAICNNFTRV